MYNNYIDENKFFYKDFKELQKLATILFNILISISENSLKNKKYIELSKILVQRITIWKPMPSFPICLESISFYRLGEKF